MYGRAAGKACDQSEMHGRAAGKTCGQPQNEKRMKKGIAILIIGFLTIAALVSGCTKGGTGGVHNTTSDYGRTVENSLTINGTTITDNTTGPAENGQTSTAGATTVTGGHRDDYDSMIGKIKAMTLDEKIGQMFIVGFKGYALNDSIRSMIQDYHIGGVILFGNNVKNADQLLQLINSIKKANSENSTPLFISVDEEGGRISRLPVELHKFPSNEEIGKVNNSDFSYSIGSTIAEEISAFGFNMDFAPVLDIFSNPENTVIADRSFGTEPQIVSKLGVQTMNGIRTKGVIPVVKHFPGHGDTSVDSHVGLPSVGYDMDRLKKFEFVPFEAAIKNQADAVMIAHILMQRIDPKYPASLSKTVITDILREKMNFSGVVITDDMTMDAIDKNYAIGSAVTRSVSAGSDIILVCHGYDNQLDAISALKTAVINGTVPEKRIDDSVLRILMLKSKYGLKDEQTPSVNVDEINKKIDEVLSKWYNVSAYGL